MARTAACALLLAAAVIGASSAQSRYLGRELGALSELHHGVRARAFAVDARTLYLHDLHYDGEGPAAYFYVGSTGAPAAAGATRLRDERGGAGPLRKYRGEGVALALPDGMTFKDIKWFAIWCDEYEINFGDVRIPRELEYPRPARLGALRGVHGVSSDPVVVVDAQTLLVPNFSYDGEAPDAKFWVGRGERPSPQGVRIPDENGKEAPLRKYDRKTIVLTLPGELTVFDIGHFAVWCEAFTVNFGHVVLPRAKLANVPPSLKMLGVSPQRRNEALVGSTARPPSLPRTPARSRERVKATTYRPPHPALLAGPAPAAPAAPAPHSPHRRADSPPEQQLSHDAVYERLQQEFERNEQQLRYYQALLEQQRQLEAQRAALQMQLQQAQLHGPQLQVAPPLDPQRRELYQRQLEAFDRGGGGAEPEQYRLLQTATRTVVDPIQKSVDLDLDPPQL